MSLAELKPEVPSCIRCGKDMQIDEKNSAFYSCNGEHPIYLISTKFYPRRVNSPESKKALRGVRG